LSGNTAEAGADSRVLAAQLAPLLRQACGDRLGDITWFKADWQRGGAATGNALFDDGAGGKQPVVVKLPVVQRELLWMRRLQDQDDDDPVVPRLHASGEAIGGYDLAWIVIERLPHGPLGLQWKAEHLPRLAEAIARFHLAAARHRITLPPPTEPWAELLDRSAQSVRTNQLPERKRWLAGLREMSRRRDRLVEEWEARPVDTWLHGDAHIANAMSRHGLDEGSVSLIDLAEVHPGHWIEDAVYLERQFWGRPERLGKSKPVRAVADARRHLELPVGPSYPRLAMIRRALLAATAPRFIRSEGNPRHLEACLKWLETALAELK
jgi:hypothetical protein